jgi:exonuclease III
MALTLATWNVNSLKVRLPHLLDWLAAHGADIVCLQETKLADDRFPVTELQQAGYESVFAGQKTYNGVAILTRSATVGVATDVQANLPNFRTIRNASSPRRSPACASSAPTFRTARRWAAKSTNTSCAGSPR